MTILYSTGCPLCKDLKKRLDEKYIPYQENREIEKMRALGITHVPMLSADGQLLDYPAAIKWLKNH